MNWIQKIGIILVGGGVFLLSYNIHSIYPTVPIIALISMYQGVTMVNFGILLFVIGALWVKIKSYLMK